MEQTYALYTDNHQLNYDEAVRRIEYWNVNHHPMGVTAIAILVQALRKNRDNLYFEPKEDANVQR